MSNKRMNIQIIYENEVILNLRVRSLDRVSELKERVGARTQLDPHTISLAFNGKDLHESLKLDHCGINEDGLSLMLSIIEPVPDRVSMEEIPWHARISGSTQLPKDQYTHNALNGNVSVVARQNGGSFARNQDGTEPNFIDSRTHYHVPYEDTLRPQSNNLVRAQQYGYSISPLIYKPSPSHTPTKYSHNPNEHT